MIARRGATRIATWRAWFEQQQLQCASLADAPLLSHFSTHCSAPPIYQIRCSRWGLAPNSFFLARCIALTLFVRGAAPPCPWLTSKCREFIELPERTNPPRTLRCNTFWFCISRVQPDEFFPRHSFSLYHLVTISARLISTRAGDNNEQWDTLARCALLEWTKSEHASSFFVNLFQRFVEICKVPIQKIKILY